VSDFWSTFGVDLHVDVDPAQGRRAGLEYALRAAIRSGRLATHSRLPSTRALAQEFGLSRGTVSAAYDQLTAEGYLIARRGSGTTVAEFPQSPGVCEPEPHAARTPRFDLSPGSPDPSSFPTALWLKAMRRALNAAPLQAFGYGDVRGTIELRVALADYLGRTRGVVADAERIVMTSGYLQALSLLAGLIARRPGATIAMEDPGLPYHREVVRRAGARVLPLPVDALGARTDLLAGPDFAEVDAVVVTPAHQFPAGMTLHASRRRALVEWARSRNTLIIEDDYDAEFRYDRQPVGAIQGVAPDHVAYVGTVSKTLGPALRLGWVVLPAHLAVAMAEAKRYTDHHAETFGQLALADLIATHAYDRHVRACRVRYGRRRDLLLSRLDAAKATHPAFADLAVEGIAAGLHALVTLPPDSGVDEPRVLAAAARHGLALGSLGPHWHERTRDTHSGASLSQGVIVGYGKPTESAYPGALDALMKVLQAALVG
jgi:GntR family transcriptional regulator/MocR family aminotransferase